MRICPINYNSYKNIYRLGATTPFRGSSAKETQTLAQKYNIDVAKLPVRCPSDITISDEQKADFVEKILEAHELALKNVNYGNITAKGYATNIGLENGIWHLATNFNNTRNEISAICGERSAILGAYNDTLKSMPIENTLNQPLQFKVKYMLMSSACEPGTDSSASHSCVDCLSWYNTNRYFNGDTLIGSLEKDKQTGQIYLELKKLDEVLPRKSTRVKISRIPTSRQGVIYSEKAKKVMQESGIKEDTLRELAIQTEDKFLTNRLCAASRQPIACGILANGKMFFGQKIDYSKRWFEEPLGIALAKAIDVYNTKTKVDAICYMGKRQDGMPDADIINIQKLGRVKTSYGNKNTFVITTEDNRIQVRTMEDYLPSQTFFIPQDII